MLSMAQEYALRALVYLAGRHTEGPIGHLEISRVTKVPAAYLSKILQTLAKSELLESKRGANGGFSLSVDPSEISVLDVLDAVDPIKRITACPLGLASHAKKFCPMHARLCEAQETLEAAFGESMLSDLLTEPGRPIPLVESELQS